ncbi:MAG: hypothetical protein KF812_06420 [Fimbriimonadaceae bacterium]|nr:hypothetical protein [Fimbriimonadaceae bacterium]
MKTRSNRRLLGQTLVIAIIILGVLLILGTAFAGIVYRNINQAGNAADRGVGSELAEAGVKFAHNQLLNSDLGADWRPTLVAPALTGDFSRDPDLVYLRQADGAFPFPGTTRPDFGGPDGYGPYARVFYDKGRALIRVRYAPNDFAATAQPTGNLRQPGAAQNLISIEVVGRPGELRTAGRIDPSKLLSESVQAQNYPDIATKADAIGRMKAQDLQNSQSKKLMAFASIGIIEHARFITNKHQVSRPAEVGLPIEDPSGVPSPNPAIGLGLEYEGYPIGYDNTGTPISAFNGFGRAFAEPNGGSSNNFLTAPGGGSLWSNADLTVYGVNRLVLNATLGESWAVNGEIRPANNLSSLVVSRARYNRATDQWVSDYAGVGSTMTNPIAIGPGQMDSRSPAFTTIGSVLRDSYTTPDAEGFPRGIGRKEPPSILQTDTQTGRTRYAEMSRRSGALVNGRNIGPYGLGRNVYVDSRERANVDPGEDREDYGAIRSLPSDWLNPNNANSLGWQGPFYVPVAPYVRLLPDGFEIVRDARSSSPTWRNQFGGNTGQNLARFRVRTVEYPVGSGRFRPFIMDSILQPALANQPGTVLTDNDFRTSGRFFDGVLFFEGDVRIRGVIPTDQQITLVANGCIYIEGSIVKGVVDERSGAVLNRPSQSTLALMARDHVVVNTTGFFGPTAGETVSPKSASGLPDTPNPFELVVGAKEDVILESQFLLDPLTPAGLGGNPFNPTTWRPFAEQYNSAISGTALSSNMLLSSSADDNGPAFVSIDALPLPYARPSSGAWTTYLVPTTVTFGANTYTFNGAANYFPPAPSIPIYGLADPSLNAFPRFETMAFPIYNRSATGNWTPYSTATRQMVANAGNENGIYNLAVDDPTLVRLRLNGVGGVTPKNYVNARTAITPMDIRIEAALYAEEGSFYVIPSHWFNTNSEDTRDNWITLGASTDERNENRWRRYGVAPEVPFYAEPLAVRVSIFGSLAENMPAPMSDQIKWKQKWGWIPRRLGSTDQFIPDRWFQDVGLNPNTDLVVPNFSISYDTSLARGSADGFTPIRTDDFGRVLPPMPRLPVSPTLAYFGEVNP